MTDDKIALSMLLEKSSDASFLREMIGFAAERLMQLETGVLCNAAAAMTKCARSSSGSQSFRSGGSRNA